MKFSENWLRTWVNPSLDTDELVERLTMAGLEVDSVEPVAPDFKGVCVGEVTSIELHPDADKLRVCKVNINADAPLNIVCGASNVAAGMRVPVACIGAKLPGDFKIKKSKLRGVVSEGMICSASELGLAESSEGIMPLPSNAPLGQSLRDYLELDDVSIDIDITPNRGDCLGIKGIAREVGLLTREDIHPVSLHAVAEMLNETFPVQIHDTDACPRYVGRIIRNVDPTAVTPLWMQERLRRSGVRSISAVVDITNYVLLEMGQPMHAFDFDKLQGGIVVRKAVAGEKLTLLDEQEVTLDNNTLVIADQYKPLAIAGVMGGLDSAVTLNSQHIFLESAFFAPLAMAGCARRYGLSTDSSYRFERGVNTDLQIRAMQRATSLVLDIVGGEAGPLIETIYPEQVPANSPIPLRRERIKRLLGIELDDSIILEVLQRLGMQITETELGWEVKPPSFRFDMSIEADLIEELARVYGYHNLPLHHPQAHLRLQATPTDAASLAQQVLTQRGYQEAITYSFVDPQLLETVDPERTAICLANPIASDMAAMRTTLWAGLLQAASYNDKRQQSRIRFFETGLRFIQATDDDALPQQDRMLAGIVVGDFQPQQWSAKIRPVDFFDVKADLEALLTAHEYQFITAQHPALHPGQTAAIQMQGETIGLLGALHPRLCQNLELPTASFLFELQLDRLNDQQLPQYQEISKYPSVRRDLAFVCDASISAQKIVETARQATTVDYLQELVIFDMYQGKGIETGQKSLAIGLIFQEKSRNLTESEVDEVIAKIVTALEQQLNAVLRK